jgi:hypothetical protein
MTTATPQEKFRKRAAEIERWLVNYFKQEKCDMEDHAGHPTIFICDGSHEGWVSVDLRHLAEYLVT